MTIAVDLGRKATKQTNKHMLLKPNLPGLRLATRMGLIDLFSEGSHLFLFS